jgi:hypothetical protein
VDKLYQGKLLWEQPDLIVKWTGDAPIRALYSPVIGTVMGHNPERRSGEDKPEGFIIAHGKHIKSGKYIEEGDLMDIAPTVLYLMGQPVPGNTGGKVLLDIIEDEFKVSNPPRYLEPRVNKN